MEEGTEEKSKVGRIGMKMIKLIEETKKKFYEKYSVNLSDADITDMFAERIIKAGGIVL